VRNSCNSRALTAMDKVFRLLSSGKAAFVTIIQKVSLRIELKIASRDVIYLLWDHKA
jgi:hypothetical protein